METVATILIEGLLFACAGVFLIYGVKAGLIERRILADHRGRYNTGRAAVARGVLYVVIGLAFLACASIVAASLVHRGPCYPESN